jgi:pimeloyl-ACP methyl ester carboxylesterase
VFGALRFAAARRDPRRRGTGRWLGRTDTLEMVSPIGRSPSPALLLAAAEGAYGEATQGEWRGSGDCVDDYFRAAMLSWRYLSATGFDDPAAAAPTRAWDLYHSSLGRLIVTGQQFGRFDPRRGLLIGTPTGLQSMAIRYRGFPWQPSDFRQLTLVGQYREPTLSHIFRRPGLGVPVIVLRYRTGAKLPAERLVGRVRSFAATAVLRPAGPRLPCASVGSRTPALQAAPPPGLAVLELYDPLRTSCVEVAAQTVPLASDISAPAAVDLRSSEWQPVQEFFRPDTETEATLVMVEPYQRGKIPLVFVHGLLSDPMTYLDIVNEIRADPQLIASYQIWGFSYPTGGPFLGSAARLRTLLRTTIARCTAACGDDPALHHMVIIGHSMGGLITKLQVAASGNVVWDHIANRPFDEMILAEKDRKELASRLFFTPLPFVDRVVLIATPHDGSPWAKRLVARFAGKLVEFSERDDERYQKILRDNSGAIKPEFAEGLPTSIDMLEEDNPILVAERQLRIDSRVKVHSIIGTGKRMLRDGPADGIVPVSSARQPDSVSEAYIAATHTTILRNIVTTREIKRILSAHRAESGCHSAPSMVASQEQAVR